MDPLWVMWKYIYVYEKLCVDKTWIMVSQWVEYRSIYIDHLLLLSHSPLVERENYPSFHFFKLICIIVQSKSLNYYFYNFLNFDDNFTLVISNFVLCLPPPQFPHCHHFLIELVSYFSIVFFFKKLSSKKSWLDLFIYIFNLACMTSIAELSVHKY